MPTIRALARRRLTAEEEIGLSTELRRLEKEVERGCRSVPAAVVVLDKRSNRKETTVSRHVDRLARAVEVCQAVRPRPEVSLRVKGLWRKTEELRWELAMSGYRIAVGEARKMAGRGLDHEDLVNEGIVGLLNAAKRFDPGRKLRFSTYARWWVRAQMMRAIDTTGSTVRLPGGLLEKIRRVSMLKAQLEKDAGRWSMDELSQVIGLSVEEVRDIMAVEEETTVVPLTTGPESNGGGSEERRNLEDVLADENVLSQDRVSELTRMLKALRNAVATLLPHHQAVVSLYLGLDATPDAKTWTLQSAADTIGISRERVRQLLLTVKERVSVELCEESDGVPFLEEIPTPVDPAILLDVIADGRMSASTVAKRVYGPSYRRTHLQIVEKQLEELEEEGLVDLFPGERKTLWQKRA